MMWIKKLLRKWMMEAAHADMPNKPLVLETGATPNQISGEAQVTVALRKAVNGHILEMGAFAPNPRGPDWTYSHFLIPEGESVQDAIAALLVNHRLSK